MNRFENVVVATTLLVCGATAYGQSADIANDENPLAVPAQQKNSNPPKEGVIRYSAGGSIPLGFTQKVQKTLPPAMATNTQITRYSAGDSIPLAYPAPRHAGVQAIAASQKESAGYSDAVNIPLAGALGDSLTTHLGLGQAGLSEANGLINTSPAGLIGLFAVKAGMVYYLEKQKPQVRTAGLKTAAGVWGGFTMNNLLLIAGSTNPVSLVGGALFGAYMFHRQGITLDKEAAANAVPGIHTQAR